MSKKITRRHLLAATGAAALTGGVAWGATQTFRWHHTPMWHPFLRRSYLETLPMPDAGAPRVLFIGNSLTLQHELPAKIAALAEIDGRPIRPALAAANGARLVETMRLKGLERIMQPGLWEVLVLQDHTRTPLSFTDRVGSQRAMDALIKRVAPVRVLLYPPFPARHDHAVYQDAGPRATEPTSPADYAERTIRHYTNLAAHLKVDIAPVPELWMAANDPEYYVPDGLHASAKGADFIAGILWDTLRLMV